MPTRKINLTELYDLVEGLKEELTVGFGGLSDRFTKIENRVNSLEYEITQLRTKIFGNGADGFYQDYKQLEKRFSEVLEACIASGILGNNPTATTKMKMKWELLKEWGSWIIRVIGIIIVSLIGSSVWCGFPKNSHTEKPPVQELFKNK